MKITYEFDPYEDQEALKMVQNAHEMRSALFDIHDKVRSELKWGEVDLPDHAVKLLEEIQDLTGIIWWE